MICILLCHNAEPTSLFQYLAALFKLDPHLGRDFQHLQVALYAEFDRASLMHFLRSSNYYPLQDALTECQARSFIPEMVFLLGMYIRCYRSDKPAGVLILKVLNFWKIASCCSLKPL